MKFTPSLSLSFLVLAAVAALSYGSDGEASPAAIFGCCKKTIRKIGEFRKSVHDEFDDLTDAIEKRFDSLEQKIVRPLNPLKIDYAKFYASGISRGRVYLVTRVKQTFNIANANQACLAAGGYLLEVDDAAEYHFVYNFIKGLVGSNFFTGGNDIAYEGKFVWFNSKKYLASGLPWKAGEPNNLHGREDCIEIRKGFNGLNDWICDGVGQYVCEVPLFVAD